MIAPHPATLSSNKRAAGLPRLARKVGRFPTMTIGSAKLSSSIIIVVGDIVVAAVVVVVVVVVVLQVVISKW